MKIILVWKREVFPIEVETTWTFNRLKVEICFLTGVPPGEQKLQGLVEIQNGDTIVTSLNLHNNHKVLLIQQREKVLNICTRFLDEPTIKKKEIDLTANDVFSYIPRELAIEIFMLLKVTSILVCRLVSKLWNEAANSQTLWLKQFHKKWHSLLVLPNQDSRKDWRGIFAAKFTAEKNWKEKKFTTENRRIGTYFPTCLQFFDQENNLLIYGDGISVIWEKACSEAETYTFTSKRLIGHKSEVTSLFYMKNSPLIISGDKLGNVILWDTRLEANVLPWETKSSEFVGILPAHSNSIMGIKSTDDYMFTFDGNSVKVWDLNQMILQRQIKFIPSEDYLYSILDQPREAFNFKSLEVRRDQLISSNGKIINEWDLRTGKNTMSIITDSIISCTQVIKDHFILTSSDMANVIEKRDLRYPSDKPTLVYYIGLPTTKFWCDGVKIVTTGANGLHISYNKSPQTVIGITNGIVSDFVYQSNSIAFTNHGIIIHNFKKNDDYLNEFYGFI